MIDTITIKIHHLELYWGIYEQFYNFQKSKKNRFLTVMGDVATGEVSAPKTERLVLHSSVGKFLPVDFMSSLYVPSSDYSFAIRVDLKASDDITMEMTFSIPKYKWGANLFQFISFPPKSGEATYSKLMGFLKEFFRKEFVQQPSWDHVEIRRIDLCYNQFFASKKEALAYQEAQFEHMRMLSRSKNARFVPQNGWNWTLLTEGYSFKCYHKGTEFVKNDFPKLQRGATPYRMPKKNAFGSRKYFNEGIPKRYNLDYLTGVADCMLRYEITYRKSFMHYMVGYTMFEAIGDQPGYVTSNLIRKYVKKVDKMGAFVVARIAGFREQGNCMAEHYVRYQREYYLRSAFDRTFDPSCLSYIYDKQSSFNEGVFRLLFDTFWEKVKEAQINERSNVPEMLAKIKDYQARCANRKKAGLTSKKGGGTVRKGGVNTARLAIPALLSTFMDVRLLKQHLPRNTYQRLISDLKKAGVEPRAYELTIVRPTLDYVDYMASIGNLISNID